MADVVEEGPKLIQIGKTGMYEAINHALCVLCVHIIYKMSEFSYLDGKFEWDRATGKKKKGSGEFPQKKALGVKSDWMWDWVC